MVNRASKWVRISAPYPGQDDARTADGPEFELSFCQGLRSKVFPALRYDTSCAHK